MVRLENTGLFSDVDLNTLKQQKVGNSSNFKSFHISCVKKPPASLKTNQKSAKMKAKK